MLRPDPPVAPALRLTVPEELIRVGGDWYVHAGSALADDETSVLKQDETFAIFDRYGDIQPIGLGEQGVYREGTRHLSQLALKVAGKRPLLLSSTVSEDNVVLTVDLANPEFVGSNGEVVHAETVHVLRTLFLWSGALHERVDLRNYGDQTVDLPLSHYMEADFHDIFEVRGMRRARHGQIQPPQAMPNGVRLAYDGLDGRQRATNISWSVVPQDWTGSSLELTVSLQPRETHSVYLRFVCTGATGLAGEDVDDFETAFQLARAERREALDAMCRIESSNDYFNAWVARARADLLMLRTQTEAGPYPYAGIPWFSAPFGRDGLLTALEALWVEPGLAAGVLRYLATTQASELDPSRDAEPGKILHESRHGEMPALGEVPFERYYGSVDATPLFILLAGAYYRATGDMPLIDSIWPNIQRALRWIDEYGDFDGDGFVEYLPNPGALINQGWKDSNDSVFHADGSEAPGAIALAEVQAYVYAAKLAAAQLAEARGAHDFASALRVEALTLQNRFEAAFWREEIGMYALALDGDKRPCDVRSSNAGHALFSGIATAERGALVAEMLASDAAFSGWGVRTIFSTEARYNPMSYHNGSVWPHDNALIADGLSRYHRPHDVLRIFDGLFAATQTTALHRLPELFCGFPRRLSAGPTRYPVAATPQAWASASVFMLLRACLGMSVDATEARVTFDRPMLPRSLQWLRIRHLQVGSTYVDIDLHRSPSGVMVFAVGDTGPVEVRAV